MASGNRVLLGLPPSLRAALDPNLLDPNLLELPPPLRSTPEPNLLNAAPRLVNERASEGHEGSAHD